jgi:hypothetical protein
MGFFELIEKRVSVRSYTNQPVEMKNYKKYWKLPVLLQQHATARHLNW